MIIYMFTYSSYIYIYVYTYIYIRATTRRCKERVHMHEQGSPHAERVRLEKTHFCNSYICMCKGHPMLNEHRLEKVRSSNYQNPGTSTYPCTGKKRGKGFCREAHRHLTLSEAFSALALRSACSAPFVQLRSSECTRRIALNFHSLACHVYQSQFRIQSVASALCSVGSDTSTFHVSEILLCTPCTNELRNRLPAPT